jgi:hypothetical protein
MVDAPPPDDTVEHIVILLCDGRTARLDPAPGIGLQLGPVMDALVAVATPVADGNGSVP